MLLKISLVLAGVAIALYVAAAGYLYANQRSMLYYPTGETRPATPGFKIIRVPTTEGLSLVAGYRPAAPGKHTFVAFHGNAADWQSMAASLAPLADKGFGVLSVEYRGYRGNPGTPTEHGFYEDGRAAVRWLIAAGTAEGDIIAVGNSIGSGVAVQLAVEHIFKAVVLVSPVSSITRLASARVSWLPVSLLLTDRFDNAAKLGRIAEPVLILHGDADLVVPFAEAKFLSAQNREAVFKAYPGAGHDLMYQPAI